MGSAGLANEAASAGDDDSTGDVCFCQCLLMMLASGCYAGSAFFFLWGMLVSASFYE